MARILVSGSRGLEPDEHDFDDALLLLSRRVPSMKNGKWVIDPSEITLIHGVAAGVDRTAARWAEKRSYAIEAYPVTKEDWEKRGKAAGVLRNAEMLQSGVDGAMVFWDGESPGTRNMLKLLRTDAAVPYVVVVSP